MSVLLASLARLSPWAVDPSDDLQRSIAFLGWETPATRLLRASYGLGVLGCFLTVVTALVTPVGIRAPVTIAVGTITLLAASLLTAGPQLLATARRTRALGDAPGLVGRAVLSMRLSPSPERAAVFAASDGETALGASLARHSRRVRATNERALDRFAGAWSEWFPALERSLTLVVAAGEMKPGARDETLDHALDVILDGTRSQMREFAEEIRGPVTALYAFGILLPTALVALLPAAAAAGLPLSAVGIALVYDLLLPALLVVAAVWLLTKRPATFPPPRVRDSHPDVPDRTTQALVAGAVVAVLSWFVTTAVFPPWASPLAALGFGGGVALLLKFHPYLAVHDEIRTVEDGLTDALTLIGRRVSTGRSVEAAVTDAAEELTGPIGTVCEDAATTQRQLQVDIERAFLGDHGALGSIPSQRVRESIAFLSVAATYGQPAGSAVLALADHVDELQRVEREARHSLQTVCGALQSTGAVFGPLVAGATVALADGMATSGTAGLPGGAELPGLGLAVGVYALVLTVVLPILSTGLIRGLDRALVGVRVGRALLSGTAVYLAAYLLVGGIA